jgi:hypothetical protein
MVSQRAFEYLSSHSINPAFGMSDLLTHRADDLRRTLEISLKELNTE